MSYIVQKFLEYPIRILLVLIIIACIFGIVRAIIEVRSIWRAWNIEKQKKLPPIRYPIHFDRKG